MLFPSPNKFPQCIPMEFWFKTFFAKRNIPENDLNVQTKVLLYLCKERDTAPTVEKNALSPYRPKSETVGVEMEL